MIRRLALALALLWAGLFPAQAQLTAPNAPPYSFPCNKVFQSTPAGGATTQLLTAVAGQNIFICGWQFTSTAATTVQLETGTGTTCGTGTVAYTPVLNINTTPVIDHQGSAQFQVPSGANLCVVEGATASSVMIWYGQY